MTVRLFKITIVTKCGVKIESFYVFSLKNMFLYEATD